MLRSSGFGGTGRSAAPGISSVAGSSSHANAITCSMMTSRVFGPAVARRCSSMTRQHSSGQSGEHLVEEEDGDAVRVRRLRIKEVLAFF